MARVLTALFIATALGTASAAEADEVATGRALFQTNCAVCHMAAPNGHTLVGPNLYGIVGRTAGSLPGFAYSSAMKAAGFSWTAAKLTAYAQNPSAVVPGAKMPFAGLKKPGDASAVVTYLGTLHH